LNEGFTVYAERKLLKSLAGEDTKRGELLRRLDGALGDEGLKASCIAQPPEYVPPFPSYISTPA
jgi:aminopeptidase N